MPTDHFDLLVLAGLGFVALAAITAIAIGAGIPSLLPTTRTSGPPMLPSAERWNVLHDAQGNVKSIAVSRG